LPKSISCYPFIVQEFGARHERWTPLGGGVRNFLVYNNCCGAALFRRRCWEEGGGFDEKLKEGHEDWDFWISVTSKGWLVHTINEPLYYYRISYDSRNFKNNKRHAEHVRNLVKKHKEIYIKYIEEVVYLEEVARRNAYEVENSEAYKIGKVLIKPLSFLKKIIILK